jgi:hypothetical protein
VAEESDSGSRRTPDMPAVMRDGSLRFGLVAREKGFMRLNLCHHIDITFLLPISSRHPSQDYPVEDGQHINLSFLVLNLHPHQQSPTTQHEDNRQLVLTTTIYMQQPHSLYATTSQSLQWPSTPPAPTKSTPPPTHSPLVTWSTVSTETKPFPHASTSASSKPSPKPTSPPQWCALPYLDARTTSKSLQMDSLPTSD